MIRGERYARTRERNDPAYGRARLQPSLFVRPTQTARQSLALPDRIALSVGSLMTRGERGARTRERNDPAYGRARLQPHGSARLQPSLFVRPTQTVRRENGSTESRPPNPHLPFLTLPIRVLPSKFLRNGRLGGKPARQSLALPYFALPRILLIGRARLQPSLFVRPTQTARRENSSTESRPPIFRPPKDIVDRESEAPAELVRTPNTNGSAGNRLGRASPSQSAPSHSAPAQSAPSRTEETGAKKTATLSDGRF